MAHSFTPHTPLPVHEQGYNSYSVFKQLRLAVASTSSRYTISRSPSSTPIQTWSIHFSTQGITPGPMPCSELVFQGSGYLHYHGLQVGRLEGPEIKTER